MEIKRELYPYLERLFDDSMDFQTYQTIVVHTFKSLLTKDLKKAAPDNEKYGNEMSALIYVLLESCRNDLQPIELNSFLEDFSGSKKKRKFLLEQYKKYKGFMRESFLRPKGFEFPKLEDIDWRLDYVLKTNKIRRYYETMYTLKMKFSNEEPFIFSCSIEQLQDLLAKFRDATKQVGRVLEAEEEEEKS